MMSPEFPRHYLPITPDKDRGVGGLLDAYEEDISRIEK
jgi:hypothetical protein